MRPASRDAERRSMGPVRPQRGSRVKGLTRSLALGSRSDAIPAAMTGRDVLVCAMTGSGKTMAFLLPILQRLLQQRRSGTRGGPENVGIEDYH